MLAEKSSRRFFPTATNTKPTKRGSLEPTVSKLRLQEVDHGTRKVPPRVKASQPSSDASTQAGKEAGMVAHWLQAYSGTTDAQTMEEMGWLVATQMSSCEGEN